MQSAEAIDLVAAELLVFDWEADRDGVFGALLADGTEIRLLAASPESLLLEGILLENVKKMVHFKENLLQFLLANLSRSAQNDGSICYTSDVDQLLFSQIIPFSTLHEDQLEETIQHFLKQLNQVKQFAQKYLPQESSSPMSLLK